MLTAVRPGVPADVASWLVLAGHVEQLFGPMPDIRSAVERGIGRGTALVTGAVGAVSGGALLSRDDRPHRISWLAVAPAARGHGLGTALVRAAVDRWPAGEIEVITFGADTVGGNPARRMYVKAGFAPAGPVHPAENGDPRERYVLRR